MSFNQTAYQNGYIKKKYDRINLTIPKGEKEKIKVKAEELGLSVNKYINKLIEEDNRKVCAIDARNEKGCD